jgi:DNA-3-methyladenine glycosylase
VNVVVREAGVPHAVLIRAVEPIANINANTWGPGLLCRAMHIDRSLNGADLCGDTLWLEEPLPRTRVKIARAPRIGIDYAGDWVDKPWRFFDQASPYVSTVSAAKRRRALTRP